MVIISLELTRVRPKYIFNKWGTNLLFTLQRFGPSPSQNLKDTQTSKEDRSGVGLLVCFDAEVTLLKMFRKRQYLLIREK